VIPGRQPGRRPIPVDVPGAPYTVETDGRRLLAVLDAADVRAAHVVGISMGGLMAQEIALTAPEAGSLAVPTRHPPTPGSRMPS